MTRKLFTPIFLAGLLFAGNGGAARLDKPLPENMSMENDTKVATGEIDRREPLQLVAVDYCYAGSILDPASGEIVDLFVLCGEDGVEQNMDLA
jgi:hypothetical protein